MAPEYQIEQIPYYLTWKLRHEVMYPELTIEDIKLKNDPDGLHFGLYVSNQLTAVLSLFEQGEEVQLRKFATLNEQQGKGYGKLLLQYAIDFSIKLGAKTIWCNARVNVTGFYERFGFEVIGEPYKIDGYDFVKMKARLLVSRSQK